MNYNTGDRIGDYQIVDILGAGGMGRVYKVRNLISDRLEAMKVLLPNLTSDPELADRFMREIKVQASLDHPNIAKLHTAQRIDNQLVMLMEFLEGNTLEKVIGQGLDLRRGIDVILQVLSALACAHQHGVVHRDIKPANIMIMPSGQVKLMDFGIARAAAQQKLTQTGRTLGSLFYMSPEQINGAALDARSDLYSLGITLYETATGKRPFQGDSDYSIMAAHLGAAPIPPIQIDPRLPAALNDIILMSIAKDQAQRFQSAEAFGAALQSVARSLASSAAAPPALPPQAEPVRPAANASPVPTSKPLGRRGLYIAVGSVATVAILIAAATLAPRFLKSDAASTSQEIPLHRQSQPAPTPDVQNTPDMQQPPTRDTPPANNVQAIAQPTVQKPEAAIPTTEPAAQKTPQPAAQKPGVLSQMVPAQALTPPSVRPSAGRPAEQEVINGAVTSQNQTPQQRPGATAPDQGALTQAREMLMLIGTRATSVKATIDRLRQEQSRMGLGLRGDIATSLRQMEFHLDEAEAAIKSGEIARAKSSLSSAERQLEKLESFTGR